MSKNLIWTVVGVIAIAVLGWYFLQRNQAPVPASLSEEEQLESEITGLDLGDLEKEFSDVNADLQSL